MTFALRPEVAKLQNALKTISHMATGVSENRIYFSQEINLIINVTSKLIHIHILCKWFNILIIQKLLMSRLDWLIEANSGSSNGYAVGQGMRSRIMISA